jgi:hypothetical protein
MARSKFYSPPAVIRAIHRSGGVTIVVADHYGSPADFDSGGAGEAAIDPHGLVSSAD